jgi:DNA methylase
VGGRVALDKHIRPEVWRLPNTHLRAIIEGYLDGDGHHDRKNGRVRLGFARNYGLERDLRTAAARLGAALTLKPVVVTYQGGKRAAFHGEWRTRSRHWNEKDRGEVVEVRRSKARQFWDIGVEDEPHLFALASGVLTHNSKPNPMPESVQDRPTRSHEYLFLLTKSEQYRYNADAIAEPAISDHPSGNGFERPECISRGGLCQSKQWRDIGGRRNRRTVWTIAPEPFDDAHFATFPTKLVEPCILAGTARGDLVLDPFSGAGTTGVVAARLGRRFVGIDIQPAYHEMARERIEAARAQLEIPSIARAVLP